MKNAVITTEQNLLQVLAALVSKDLNKQRLWIDSEEMPNGFEYLDNAYFAGFESDLKWSEDTFSRGYVFAPAFMVALTGYPEDEDSDFERTIEEVFFAHSVAEVEDMILERAVEGSIRRGDVHIFMFHTYPNTGFAEIPFEVGYYIKDKETKKEVLFEDYKEVTTTTPKKVLFNWYDILAVKAFEVSDEIDTELFVEIPGVFDVEYIGCSCCGRKETELFVRKNVSDCFELAALRLKDDEEVREYVIESRWYEYHILFDIELAEDLIGDKEISGFGGFFIEDIMKAVKIKTIRKF